jgi:hypothetical protein
MKRTKKLTVSAMMCALSVVILYLASFFTTIDLSVSLIASLIMLLTVEELGYKAAFSVFVSTSLLSFLLLPQKYVAAMYLLFCGIYPIIRVFFERLPRAVRLIAKLLYFGATLTAVLVFAKLVLNIELYTGYMLILFYAVCILTFLLSDLFIKRFTLLYRFRLRRRLGLDKFFR